MDMIERKESSCFETNMSFIEMGFGSLCWVVSLSADNACCIYNTYVYIILMYILYLYILYLYIYKLLMF